MRVSDPKSSKVETHEGSAYSSGAPKSLLTIYSFENVSESFPASHPDSKITLHFTQPKEEVVLDTGDESPLYDIATIGDKELTYDLKLKTS